MSSVGLQHTEAEGDPSSMLSVDTAGCPQAALEQLRAFFSSSRYITCYPAAAAGGQPRMSASAGCGCGASCGAACPCLVESSKGLQALVQHGRGAGVVSLLECGPACSCAASCPARATQQSLAVRVQLCWSPAKGWCVHAAHPIPQGSFVCSYIGEHIALTEARRRLAVYDQDPDKGHALLIVRLQLPSRTTSLSCCIDATATGNLARFVNHSCDGGNLEAILVSVRGCMLPRVALFAARDIPAGEELTYAYSCQAGADGAAGSSSRRCSCGTAACSGYMPGAL